MKIISNKPPRVRTKAAFHSRRLNHKTYNSRAPTPAKKWLQSQPRPNASKEVAPISAELQQRIAPTPLDLALHRHFKTMLLYQARGRQTKARSTANELISQTMLKLLALSVDYNKRKSAASTGNKTKLYEIDATHETLRRLWFVYYECGFLGESKGGREYSAKEGLRVFTIINEQVDMIGRIIGTMKRSLHEAAPAERKPLRVSAS